MTSFRFPSKHPVTRSPAPALASESGPAKVGASALSDHSASTGATGTQPLWPVGVLNVIGIPTAISASPPAIIFGSLTVSASPELVSQIAVHREGASATLAVTAVLRGDDWRVQSCLPLAVAPTLGGQAQEVQKSGTPEEPPRAPEASQSEAQRPAQRGQAFPGLSRGGGQAASRLGVSNRPAKAATAVVSSPSPTSFARPSPTQTSTHTAMPGEIGDFTKFPDIPY